MTIGKKLIVGYLIMAVLMITLTLYAIAVSQQFLRESVGKNSIVLAEELLRRINYNLQHTIEHIQLHTYQTALHDIISKSNSEFHEMEHIRAYIKRQDQEWIGTPKERVTPFMQTLLQNKLSAELRAEFIEYWEKSRGYKLFAEVIVTNQYGANVAQTGKSSAYDQADERWWQNAKEQGYYIGEVEYDDSADMFVLPIGIRIDDEAERFIGAMKAAISITALIREAEVTIRTYHTTEIQIISARNTHLLYATKAFQFLEDVSDKAFFNELQEERGFFMSREGGRTKLFSYARVSNFGRYAGLDWILTMSHDEKEVLRPLAVLRNKILLIAGVLTTAGFAIAFFISRTIAKPIAELMRGADMIGQGDLDHRVAIRTHDEIGEFARAFNRMAERLNSITVSRDALTQEVAERKRTEEEINAQISFLDTIMEQSPFAMWIADTTGTAIRTNRTLCDTLDLTDEQLVGKYNVLRDGNLTGQGVMPQVMDVFAEQRPARFTISWSAAGAGDIESAEARDLWIDVAMFPIVDEEGQLLNVVCQWIDITERKQAEEAVARLASFPELNPNPIVDVDVTGQVQYLNPAARRLFPDLQALGVQHPWCAELTSAFDRFRHEESTSILREVLIGESWFQQAIHAVTEGQRLRMYGFDITGRKRAEQELEHLNAELSLKNSELEQVVYVTSHDLRSPLVNVQGFSKELQYLLQDLRVMLDGDGIPAELRQEVTALIDGELADDLGYILAGITKMDSLLSGLLSLSRLGRAALTVESLDMNAMISQVASTFEFQLKEAEVTLDIAPLPSCQGDAAQIDRVFSNLLGNAVKYLDPQRAGRIRIWGTEEQERVEYCVEDNGIGIAPEHQKKIFEIFHRLNPDESSGEGLGLTIIRKILDRHSGDIRVESEPGVGSAFYVSLAKGVMEGGFVDM